ncbi:MAG TPA: preprotein translocase subunit SecA [bacterium]|nr:preprotein translocase subunit SecA [bacterium]
MVLPIPRGAYAEREEPREGWLDRTGRRLAGEAVRRWRGRPGRWEAIAGRVERAGRALAEMSDRRLREVAAELRARLRAEGFREDLVARAFALVRETAARTVGERPYDVQVIGGRVLLAGMVAEMETGEGKTLAATLPACTAALAGIPVHVITVNDYLASRDAAWMGPIYRALGLRVGTIVHGLDPEARSAAYACDVTYGTNKEVAFDYLKDRIALRDQPSRLRLQLERLLGEGARPRRLLLRGLHFAIVDEADSVLVDEARTPLIISGGGEGAPEQRMYETALALARRLEPGRHVVIEGAQRAIRYTAAGEAHLTEMAQPLGGFWQARHRREELVRQALTALYLFERDRHYIVQDGKVAIVDEFTGRLMPDRSWEHGLHQLIEAKEGVPLTNPHDALARISYQRFFRRYLRLAGMTGTAREVAAELWAVYGLAVVSIRPNRPLRRRALPDRIYRTGEARWAAVADRIAEVHRSGRPVLVGTRSVAASEHLSAILTARGLAHQVLNARQDREEAEIIARAGGLGQITVATNMAGRGTDIRLGPGVGARGGLHVIATERHEAGRIDRQLFGRCGRQGDPGSYEAIVSLQDELFTVYGGRLGRWLAHLGLGRLAVRRAQRTAERLHARMRRDLLKVDEQLDTALAFSGRRE